MNYKCEDCNVGRYLKDTSCVTDCNIVGYYGKNQSKIYLHKIFNKISFKILIIKLLPEKFQYFLKLIK